MNRCLLLLILPLCVSCATVQADLVKVQTDLQAKKAELIPKVQAGIVYANLKGDREWSLCLSGLLAQLQKPASEIPDLSNVFIRVEVEHQAIAGVLGGPQNSAFIEDMNLACAPWVARVKGEAVGVAAFVAGFFK